MKKETLKNTLKIIIDETKEEMNDFSIDFVNDNYYSDIHYLSDAFAEYADNNYYDPKQFYFNNSSYCNDVISGLYDPESLADIVKKEGIDGLLCEAGAVGEFCQLEIQLYNDEENIKKVLSIYEILSDIERGSITDEEISKIETASDIEDIIDDYVSRMQ